MDVWPGGVGVGEPVQRAMDKNLVRVDMAAVRAHGRAGGRLHGEWGRDPQIRAIGEVLGVDIVVLRMPGEFGAVDYYECGGAHALAAIASWRDDVLPRLHAQQLTTWPPPADPQRPRARVRLAVLVNRSNQHFEGTLPA